MAFLIPWQKDAFDGIIAGAQANAALNRQLAAGGLFVKPGAIRVVDATVIRAATRRARAPRSHRGSTPTRPSAVRRGSFNSATRCMRESTPAPA